jgi:TetR/AcrR family transcriptional repressor of nem operon
MSNLSTTSEEILRCARSLIIDGGYNGFSYADIAEVVEIRKASIHHHFPTKVDLVHTLIVQYRAEVEAGIAQLERQVPDPAGQLQAYANFWEACINDETASFCVCALLAAQIPVLPEKIVLEIRAYFRTLSAWVASVLERGAIQGRFKLTTTAHSEAERIMATIHGAMLSARAYGDPKIFGYITQPLLEELTVKH